MTVEQEARLQENREVHTKIGKTWFIDITKDWKENIKQIDKIYVR